MSDHISLPFLNSLVAPWLKFYAAQELRKLEAEASGISTRIQQGRPPFSLVNITSVKYFGGHGKEEEEMNAGSS